MGFCAEALPDVAITGVMPGWPPPIERLLGTGHTAGCRRGYPLGIGGVAATLAEGFRLVSVDPTDWRLPRGSL